MIKRKKLFIVYFFGTIFFLSLGAAGTASRFFEKYYAKGLGGNELKAFNLLKTHASGNLFDDMGDNNDCNFWSQEMGEKFNHRFNACFKKYGRAIVVLGDSHAMNLYNMLFRSNFGKFVVGISSGGCRPSSNSPGCFYDAFSEFSKTNKHLIDAVIFHQSGAYLLTDYRGRVDSSETFIEDKKYSVHYESIEKTAAYLTRLSDHVKIIWLGPFIEARVKLEPKRLVATNFSMNQTAIKRIGHLNQEIIRIINSKFPKLSYSSPIDTLSLFEGSLMSGDCLMYRDVDHFSVCGELIVGSRVSPWLKRQLVH